MINCDIENIVDLESSSDATSSRRSDSDNATDISSDSENDSENDNDYGNRPRKQLNTGIATSILGINNQQH